MSDYASAVRLMADKGMSAHDIADILEAMAGAPTSGAERQRRYRERQKEARNDGDVTGDVTPLRNERDAGPSPQSPPLKAPPDPLQTTPPLTPQPIVGGARAKPRFDPPEGVTAEQFKAFRQQRKKPLNDHSYSLLCGKLASLAEAGWPPGEMIDLAIERGWETVFEPKDQVPPNGRQPNNLGSLRGTRPDPSLDFVRQANADLAAERGGSPDHRGDRTALPSFGPG